MLTWMIMLAWQQADQAPTASWRTEGYEVVPITGMESPTGLTLAGGQWYAVADVDESWPGLYRLDRTAGGGFAAQRVRIFPQLDLESISWDETGGSFHLLAGRRFSNLERDWRGHLLTIEAGSAKTPKTWYADIPCSCYGGTMACGMTGLARLPDETWVGVKKKDLASIHVMRLNETKLETQRAYPIALDRQFVTVSEMTYQNPFLLFLIRDHWCLARLHRRSLASGLGQTLALERVFDFGFLKPLFRTDSRTLTDQGLAEGFAFGAGGTLYLLFNNRTQSFLASAERSALPPTPHVVVLKPAASPP